MQALPKVSEILLPLFSSLGLEPGEMPVVKPGPSSKPYTWGVHLQGRTLDLSQKPDSIANWAVENGFLNFDLADEWYLNWLNGKWEWPLPEIEGKLRDVAVATHIREPRKGLRLFFRRLEFLPEANPMGIGNTTFLESEKTLLNHQQFLVAQLEDRSTPWPPQLLGGALETFRVALVQFWENESLDVEGDPGRTHLRTVIWAVQRSFLTCLLPALTP